MFNSVRLMPLKQHCHRFLCRDLEPFLEPDNYVIERVNMGDTLEPAMCTEAIDKTAHRLKKESEEAAKLLKKYNYVDDLINSYPCGPCHESGTRKGSLWI